MKQTEKMQIKFFTLQGKIDEYNKLEHFVRIYKESPKNWTIDINHFCTNMLGTSFDYSFENFMNDEIKHLIATRIIDKFKIIEKELEELLKDI